MNIVKKWIWHRNIMKKQEIKELVNELRGRQEISGIGDDCIGALMLDRLLIKNVIIKSSKFPLAIREAWYWTKFKMFLYGIYDIAENYSESVSLSSKLFSNPKDKKGMECGCYKKLKKLIVWKKLITWLMQRKAFC